MEGSFRHTHHEGERDGCPYTQHPTARIPGLTWVVYSIKGSDRVKLGQILQDAMIQEDTLGYWYNLAVFV